ncbi:hypothetical protein GLOIN_2v1786147 [Rhizophagus irregularis DAOM 181602=DAOM 197198]|nr:hypothetical protein GLOIN_2v1786147 [Rhizophagus irregularis DAOM 181602=DAOM 197198]
MLILGILPGSNEVKLHRVNHYLSPIITELELLWEGVNLNRTNECPNGKDIRAALIIASCDIPGAQKLCGHISALASCYRCEKRANNCNFGGIAKWITKRIWIDEGVLTEKDLQSIQKKMDEFKVPSDLGLIPGKIHCGEGFSNFTAD